ncbi:uncharacterized protein LOC105690879 [Athalia rosae]|uniref:uncharacterized protein LOC105690879 n=1 Tax=Athalia rosae TaxID=37344 RepID=UPI0020334844|nr:uncharacterized protein LOC105690879 [Athalia rosae]
MQGVNHFTFYNKSVSTDVSKVFQYYANKGIATILQWKLPSIYQFELTLRMDGSFAAWNDCLYRSSFHKNYKYVLIADVDEFIVPRKHENLTELMGFLDPPNNLNTKNEHASFEFRNVFFYLMHPDDKTDYDPTVPYLYLQAKTERVKDPEKAGYLTKYIARSQDVVELGYHKVWFHHPGTSIFMNSFDRLVVDADVALSHHYSDCEAETAACHFRPTIIDRTTHKYIKEIGTRLKRVCKDIFEDAGCPAPKN